jgi:hypothetical protein
MSQDPRETFRRLQQTLQQRSRQGFGVGAGIPGGASLRPLAGLILLGLGGVIVSNSLFNGMSVDLAAAGRRNSDLRRQLTVAIELSSIPE